MIFRSMLERSREDVTMLKIIVKILALPLILILSIAGFLINAAIKLYCLVSAVALKILAFCALIAVCTSQWQPLLIIGIMIAIGIGIAFCASFITAQIEICRDSLCGYLRA